MDTWVVQQLSFWYTVYEVKPTAIVDKLINFWVELCTPGRGTGNNNWWMQGLRTLEQSSERTSRELDIRTQLRHWDRDHPQIHHELVVRWLCGAAVSVVCSSLYNAVLRRNKEDPYRRY